MAEIVTPSRPLEPGTTGWSAANLADPEFAFQWDEGRFEIVEGVLTKMPPPMYFGNKRLHKLIKLLDNHLDKSGQEGSIAQDVDVILLETRVIRADAVFLTPQDEERQRRINATMGVSEEEGRLRVAPTLIIQSVSRGHELHDRRTKRLWYAEAGVAHYWIFDVYQQSLECLILDKGSYRIDQSGQGPAELRPTLFPGLTLQLSQIWD
jgi:Uma2 family endonuclease